MIYPANTVMLDQSYQGTIPSGTYFVYNGKLYIANGSYTPKWHGGMPSAENAWAWIPTELNWDNRAVYSTSLTPNAIVLYDGIFYENVGYSGSGQNPKDHSGGQGSGKPWRISSKQNWTDEDFDFIEGTNIRLYQNNHA